MKRLCMLLLLVLCAFFASCSQDKEKEEIIRFCERLATDKTVAMAYIPGRSVMEVLAAIQQGAACKAAMGEALDKETLAQIAAFKAELEGYGLRQMGFAVDVSRLEDILLYGTVRLENPLPEEEAAALLELCKNESNLKVGFDAGRRSIWFIYAFNPNGQGMAAGVVRGDAPLPTAAKILEDDASMRLAAWMTSALKAGLQQAGLPLEENAMPQAVALTLDFKKGLRLQVDFSNEQTPAALVPILRAGLAAHLKEMRDYPEVTEKYLAELEATTIEAKGTSLAMECRTTLDGFALEVGLVLAKAQAKARAISCMNNLKQLLLGIIVIYAGNHNDKMPDDLNALVEKGYLSKQTAVLVCPKCQQAYRYFGAGLKQVTDDASRTILLACPGDHMGRVNVGFADGHVESVPREDFKKALSTRAAGALPVLP